MTRFHRILGLAIVPLVLAACANAPRGPEAGATSGSSVPGVSGGGTGTSGGGDQPNDRVHGFAACTPVPIPSDAGPDTPVSSCADGGHDPSIVAQPTVPRPGMADVAPIGWTSSSVSRDGLAITITYVSGVEPCHVLDHVAVDQGMQTVTVTLFEGHDPDAGPTTACPDIAMYRSVLVRLDAPLAGREVVDGTR